MSLIAGIHDQFNISYSALNEMENNIHISFVKNGYRDKVIAYLKDHDVDLNCIEFDENQDYAKATKVYRAGSYLNAGKSHYNGTIGFNAINKNNNEYGLVTAGHLYYPGLLYKTYFGSAINYSENTIHKVGDNVDAMFIPYHAQDKWQCAKGYSLCYAGYADHEYSIDDVGNIQSYNPPLMNTLVTKYGTHSGKVTGKIKSTSITTTIVDENKETVGTVKDLFDSGCYNISGDSGGPVGVEIVNSDGEKRLILMGITSCGDSEDDGNVTGMCVKIGNILSRFNLRLYC